MITQAPKRAAMLAAIAFALSCVLLMVFVWTQFKGSVPFAPEGYRVDALFKESGLLVPGADVRISGVTVGRVASVQARGLYSYVSMDIKSRYAPIPVDTRAILRQKTLLGEAYVGLSTGTGSARKLADGGTIPASQVESTQQLDQVLGGFDKPTQRNLVALLNGTFTALAGRGQDLNNAFGNIDPAVTNAASVVGVLNSQRGAVQRLVSNAGEILTAVGDRAGDLQSLITAGDQVFSATATRDAQLTATINALPGFMSQLRTSLGKLDTTLGIAKPSVLALEPAGPLVRPALRDLITLSGPAIRLLHDAPGLLDAATAALPSITRFTSAFKPAVDVILPAAQEVVPAIDFMSRYKAELVSTMANMGAMLDATAPATTTGPVGNIPAGTATYGRVMPPLNSEMFMGQSIREPTNRHNAYIAPGGWASLATGLTSSDCNNTHNTAQVIVLNGSNIPCVASKGWTFNGLTRYYPHVTRKPVPR